MKVFRKICIVLLLIVDIFVFMIMYLADTNTYKAIDIDKYISHVSGKDYLETNSNNYDYTLITKDNNENIWVEPALNTPLKDSAIVFYPGAYVDPYAYLPIMYELSKEGYVSCISTMSYSLAFFSVNSATNVINNPKYSNLNWYIAGHSLGGVAASMYYAKNSSSLSGVILLASYSTKDLTTIENVKVLSVYGSCDKVLSIDAYNKNKHNLSNLTEYVIEGGNHAQFASYGKQKGDGEALIDKTTQYNITRKYIKDFISK